MWNISNKINVKIFKPTNIEKNPEQHNSRNTEYQAQKKNKKKGR